MPKVIKHVKCWLIFLASGFLCQPSSLYASSFSEMYIYYIFQQDDIDISLTDKDQEKLNEASTLNNQANDLLLKANDLYMQASMHQQSGDIKKAEKAEADALKNELDAAKLFQEANGIKKDVYKSCIDKFWKEFEGNEDELVNAKLIQETAEEYFFRAEELRKEASRIKNKQDSYNKLSEANETELLAIEKLISAYEIYDVWPSSYSESDLVTYPDAYGSYESSTTEDTYGSYSGYSDTSSYSSYGYTDTQYPSTTTAEGQDQSTSYESYSTDNTSVDNYSSSTTGSSYSAYSEAQYSPGISEEQNQSSVYGSSETSNNNVDYSTNDTYSETNYSTTDTYGGYTSGATDGYSESSYSYSQDVSTSEIKQPEGLGTDVKVDERLLKIFNTYEQRPTEVSNEDKLYLSQYIQDYNPEKIRELWDEYRNNDLVYQYEEKTSAPASTEISAEVASYNDEIEQSVSEDYNEQTEPDYNYASTETAVTEPVTSNNTSTETTENYNYAATTEPETEEIGVVTESYNVPDPNAKIIYKIQIAANSTPLSQGILRKLYGGNKNVSMINEEGWYKYSIGDFETFAEASDFKKGLNVKDAFIVAYRDAQKVSFSAVKMETSTTSAPSQSLGRTQIELVPDEASGNIIFEVQIAASKRVLTNSQLKLVYPGQEEIRMREEEGWIKYQIGHTFSYDEARRLLATAKIRGSFIVAYRNGKKLLLWKAIQEYEQTGGILFVVQVAASKKPLSEPQLKRIYAGNVEIREKEEEGWYKYQLVVGNNYSEARRIRNNSGVRGAFVVAYKNNVKVNLREAIEISEK